MMTNKDQISVGLVDLYEPTLLLSGSASRLQMLADLMEEGGSSLNAEDAAMFAPVQIELDLHLNAKKTHLQTVGSKIDWFISPLDARQYAKLIRAVAESERPSHTYLDGAAKEDMEIMVSKGEYDVPAIFFRDEPSRLECLSVQERLPQD